jgi:hypothetical protein
MWLGGSALGADRNTQPQRELNIAPMAIGAHFVGGPGDGQVIELPEPPLYVAVGGSERAL